MENKEFRCSCHSEINAISYCDICKIYICNKCLNHHNELFKNHKLYNLDKNSDKIIIDICREKDHERKLEFYCKNHNILCCVCCISKLKIKKYGQHKDCEVCPIESIINEKKNILNENIKQLEELSNNIEQVINELKIKVENIEENKEKLKLKVQKIFTKIRTILNEREDEILLEINKKFNDNFYNEGIIKENLTISNKIKKNLEIGKSLIKDWNNDNKLSIIINNCINLENNIKHINDIKMNIDNIKPLGNNNINFFENNDFYSSIKSFGKIILFNSEESFILKKEEDLIKFIEIILRKIKINKIKLIYQSSKEGFKYDSIVNKINNESNLIFLYLTGNKRIFGNYIQTKLENIRDSDDHYYNDENAFVFSLNNDSIYQILKPEKAIRIANHENAISTGNTAECNGFYFSENIINDKGLLNTPKVYDFKKNMELTNGENNFNELEIFKIL